MKIFDSHCHLNDEKLYTKVDEVIQNSFAMGVDKMVVVGYDLKSSLLAVELAERFDCIYATIGYHPTDSVKLTNEDYLKTIELANHPKVVAIGEIGLDYYWIKDPVERDIQKKWFITQINLANKIKKPIVIHSRDANEECLKILKENKPEYGAVMHCYSGSAEMLKQVLDMGMLISLGGPVTFANAKTPKEVAFAVPLDKLLVETDSPYLTPHPHRGKENYPGYTKLVVEEIARIKGLSVEEVSNITYDNAIKFFGIK